MGAHAPKKNPLLGAAVVKAVLVRGGDGAARALYEGVLRDLGITDADVEKFRLAHQDEVAAALRAHGKR